MSLLGPGPEMLIIYNVAARMNNPLPLCKVSPDMPDAPMDDWLDDGLPAQEPTPTAAPKTASASAACEQSKAEVKQLPRPTAPPLSLMPPVEKPVEQPVNKEVLEKKPPLEENFEEKTSWSWRPEPYNPVKQKIDNF
eukprot:2827711-Amphidinium_carterae.1